MPDDDDEINEEETRELALGAARRAVQFLESKQATGCFILLTDSDKAVMWDSNLTPHVHPIGDAANVLGEMASRLRRVWHGLIADDDDGRGFLQAVKDEDSE